MRRVDAAWLTYWAVSGVGFYLADRRGVALCATARHLFHTNTPTGRFALAAGLAVGAVALERHINKETRP